MGQRVDKTAQVLLLSDWLQGHEHVHAAHSCVRRPLFLTGGAMKRNLPVVASVVVALAMGGWWLLRDPAAPPHDGEHRASVAVGSQAHGARAAAGSAPAQPADEAAPEPREGLHNGATKPTTTGAGRPPADEGSATVDRLSRKFGPVLLTLPAQVAKRTGKPAPGSVWRLLELRLGGAGHDAQVAFVRREVKGLALKLVVVDWLQRHRTGETNSETPKDPSEAPEMRRRAPSRPPGAILPGKLRRRGKTTAG